MVVYEHSFLCWSGSGRASQETVISGYFQQALPGICNHVWVWWLCMGWIPRLVRLWMTFPSVYATQFVSQENFFSFLERTEASKLWSSFSWSIICSVNCILGILSYLANIHLSVSKHHVCTVFDRVTSVSMIFSVPSISLRISWSHCFYTCVVLRCVNVNHFLYPFLCRETSVFFPALTIINKAAINLVEHVSLLYIEASFGYMPRSGIAVSSGSTTSNFQRNHQTDF